MKNKGTGSRWVLEECVNDNYYVSFLLPAITAAEKSTLTLIVDGWMDRCPHEQTDGRKVELLYCTLL